MLDTSPSSNPQPAQQSINFDLLQQQQNPQQIKTSNSGGFDDLLLTSSYQGIPPPSGFGITLNDNNLNANDFKTEAVITLLFLGYQKLQKPKIHRQILGTNLPISQKVI